MVLTTKRIKYIFDNLDILDTLDILDNLDTTLSRISRISNIKWLSLDILVLGLFGGGYSRRSKFK